MKVKFFSIHSYEEEYLRKATNCKHIVSFDSASLSIENVETAKRYKAISVFTNDDLSSTILEKLKSLGIEFITIRATGYDHVDLVKASSLGIKVANVPEYSPYSIAEHAVMLMLSLNRKLILAEQQIRSYNFSLDNLIGFDMHGKTVGIIGMGRIGGVLAGILNGFGCTILAYDLIHNPEYEKLYKVTYTSLEEVLSKSDILSLHTPLTTETKYLINEKSLALVKDGVMIINCGRGALINTKDILKALKTGKVGALGMDVYEKEKGLFFFDHSNTVLKDDLLLELMSFKNVLITPHQAFLTTTALKNIADTTVYNLDAWTEGKNSKNELR